jgi:hypothetical protein
MVGRVLPCGNRLKLPCVHNEHLAVLVRIYPNFLPSHKMAKLSTLLLSLALVAASAAEAVLDLKPDTFDDTVLKSGKPALVEFFAPWCGREYYGLFD